MSCWYKISIVDNINIICNGNGNGNGNVVNSNLLLIMLLMDIGEYYFDSLELSDVAILVLVVIIVMDRICVC